MRLFNEVIDAVNAMLPVAPDKTAAYSETLCAAPGDKNAILFRSDTAYELGGSGKPSVCSVLFGAVPEQADTVCLYGPDLCEIRADCAFAHLTFVQLRENAAEDAYYEQLKKVGFTVFQVYPEGYHIRVSPSAGKEQVRVAKDALAAVAPLSFVNVGCSLIREFKTHPDVAYVKTVFVTKPDFDYKALSGLAAKARDITDAFRHTLESGELDCAACKMKPICDTVEGLRELHFNRDEKKNGT